MRVLVVSAAAILFFPSCVPAADASLLAANASSQVIQNARADAENLSRMRDVAMIRRFSQNGYLLAVPSTTRFYYLQAIPPAYRYCRPWTKVFLDKLSRQYYARFKRPLRVTSLVRSVAQQRRLARRNGNAADATGSQRSSHLTGATLDISKRFMTPQGESWMRNVLYTLKQRGYLYAIEEFEQPTFHVMIYPNYAEHVARLKQAARNGDLVAGARPASGVETEALRVFVGNLALPPEEIWRDYNRRTDMENRIALLGRPAATHPAAGKRVSLRRSNFAEVASRTRNLSPKSSNESP